MTLSPVSWAPNLYFLRTSLGLAPQALCFRPLRGLRRSARFAGSKQPPASRAQTTARFAGSKDPAASRAQNIRSLRGLEISTVRWNGTTIQRGKKRRTICHSIALLLRLFLPAQVSATPSILDSLLHRRR